MYNITFSLIGRKHIDKPLPDLPHEALANKFLTFFEDKVANISKSLPHLCYIMNPFPLINL